MKSLYSAIAIFLLVTILASHADAQLVWNTVRSDFDGQYNYCYDVLACNGNDCVLGGSVVDEAQQKILRMFWTSNDGGKHWVKKDPLLSDGTYLYWKSYFLSVQQINATSIVALSRGRARDGYDSNLTMLSTDGGAHWKNIDSGINGVSRAVFFYNNDSGFLISNKGKRGDGPPRFYTTTDGGLHWDSTTSTVWKSINKRQYLGNQTFAGFTSPNGPFYYTTDNFQTVNHSAVLIDSIDNIPNPFYHYYINNCSFGGLDTVIAYGSYNVSGDWTVSAGMMMRSTDRGMHWSAPQLFDSIWSIDKMTTLSRDTVIAGGESNKHILRSTDRGLTWRTDSLLLDTAYEAYVLRNVVIPSSGNPLALYTYSQIDGVPSIVISGDHELNRVEWSGYLNYHDRLYPNPATTTVNIASIESSTPFHLVDVLGRVALEGIVGDHTDIQVNVSSLPRGMYYLIVNDTYGNPVIAGKLMLSGK